MKVRFLFHTYCGAVSEEVLNLDSVFFPVGMLVKYKDLYYKVKHVGFDFTLKEYRVSAEVAL